MNEESIFAAALQKKSTEERDAFLDGVCAASPTLRANVESLLSAHQDAGDFLGSPAVDVPPTAAYVTEPIIEKPGEKIGPYKLREQIGEGGFGVVYVADQQQPVRRKVALKIIKPGMDTKEVVARFEAERQALAIMDHPNIARVIDAGSTESGRPYFVMELVHGVPINEFCDRNTFSTRQRLELFQQVCLGVQHAHQRGIIHRDLKPSNILVTLHDGSPVPKVIDFGVSKALSQQLTERTIYTAYGQVVGTPQYMSPEQAEMSGLGIDTRSDIYSLGVLLYELLTGKTPVESSRLLASGYAEMMRIIREEEPLRPSKKVSTMGADATVVANHRRTDEAKLSRTLRGELDWIVMKALDKNRERRYEHANEFASDVQRFLENEAVLACPPSQLYRFSKFVKRHRGPVIAAASLALVLCLGLIGTSIGLVKARQETQRAQQARRNEIKAKLDVERQNAALHVAKEQAIRAKDLAKQNAEETRRNLYVANMGQAAMASLTDGSLGQISRLTDPWIPTQGQPDLRGWEWYYLRSQLYQHLRTIRVPIGDHIQRAELSPDGTRLATHDGDKIEVWDINRALRLDSWTPGGEVHRMEWHPDGQQIAASVINQTNAVMLWDVDADREASTVFESESLAGTLTWSSNGSYIVITNRTQTKFIDLTDGKSPAIHETLHAIEESLCREFAWSPDEKMLVTAGGTDGVVVWDLVEGSKTHLSRALGRVFEWSPDGKRLAVGIDKSSGLQVWDISERRVLYDLVGHFRRISSLRWSPDGNLLASASEDRTIRIWDMKQGNARRKIQGHSKHADWLAWTPEGDQLISADRYGEINYWATSDDSQPPSVNPDGAVSIWNTDANQHRLIIADRLLASGQPVKVRVWDADTHRVQHVLDPQYSGIRNLAVSPDGNYLATGTAERARGIIQIWNLNTGKIAATVHRNLERPMGIASWCYWLAWGPYNKLATADLFGGIELWQFNGLQSGDKLQHFDTLNDESGVRVRALSWSSNGKYLAAGRHDGDIKVWNMETGQPKQLQSGHTRRITWIAWSPDNQSLVACGNQGITILDVENVAEPLQLNGHTNDVLGIAWSPDGSRIASASADTTVKIWDANSGQEMVAFTDHQASVVSVAWNHDGTCLASSDNSGVTYVRDARRAYAQRDQNAMVAGTPGAEGN